MDRIKVPVVFGQRGVDVATHISSYLSRFRLRGRRIGLTKRFVEPKLSVSDFFQGDCLRLRIPIGTSPGVPRSVTDIADVRLKLEAGNETRTCLRRHMHSQAPIMRGP